MATKETWQQIKKLFHSALELAPEERPAYLDAACAGNNALRQEIQSLLELHEKTGNFIDAPAYEVFAEVLANDDEFKPGETLAHYEIRSLLGEGGMGKVYLAEDTKLKRNVALKVLPLSNDRDESSRRRLLREARAAAALDHPNICAIYEVGEESGRSYIAMQYIKGETLETRMLRGRLSCDVALQFAVQVADALAEAHAHNVVHRDIKPSNILLTDRGQAKVLDFGLAKIVSEGLVSSGEAKTKSLLTQPGMIVGTAPYMSPEQVRSESIDARSDIFSFGIVLYEMLSGHRAFVRDSVAETISAILSQEPEPVAQFNDSVPNELQLIVMKALQKDRNARYQSAQEMLDDLQRIELRATASNDQPAGSAHKSGPGNEGKTILIPETTADGTRADTKETEQAGFPVARLPHASKKWTAIVALLALVAVTAIAFTIWRYLPSSQDSSPKPPTLRASQVTNWTGLDIHPALSPDGNEIAYSSDHGGSFEIYVKSLTPGGLERKITSDGQQNFQPAFSPDSQRIAFYSRTLGGIWVVPAAGGRAIQITTFGSDPTWSPDGDLVAFQSDALTDLGAQSSPAQSPSTIWVVSSTGSTEPTRITQTGNPPGGHGAPAWSPDGKRIVFCASDFARTSIWTILSKGGEATQFVNNALDPVYAPDGESIYYGSLLGLWQMRVSPSSGKPVGEPVQLISGSSEKVRNFAFSSDGKKIAYTALLTNSNIWSVPLTSETAGSPVPLTQNRTFRNALPAFSPNGKRIAFNTQTLGGQGGADGDIWLMDADGKNFTQITTAGGVIPSWFPDGEQIAFLSGTRDPRKAWFTNLNTGQDRPLLDFGEEVNYMKLSPDGKQIVFNSKRSGTVNVWKISLEGGEAKQLTFDKELMGFSCWSPDGKTIAFQIKRGDDTHIATMPSDGGQITQLTFDEGQSWIHSFSPDGDKILFAGFRNGYWNVFWFSRSTKQQRQLTHYMKLNAFVRYPAWSPLGNQIAYEYAETTGNIWIADLK